MTLKLNARKYVRCARIFYLLSNDIRSEASIAIIKKFDFNFFMISDSTSLPQFKNVFQKNLCVCVSDRRQLQSLNQSTDLVLIRYLGSSCKYLERFFFSFSPTPKIKGSSHEKKIKNNDFLKNGSNGFDYILWVYSTFETQQYDTSGFSRKNP